MVIPAPLGWLAANKDALTSGGVLIAYITAAIGAWRWITAQLRLGPTDYWDRMIDDAWQVQITWSPRRPGARFYAQVHAVEPKAIKLLGVSPDEPWLPGIEGLAPEPRILGEARIQVPLIPAGMSSPLVRGLFLARAAPGSRRCKIRVRICDARDGRTVSSRTIRPSKARWDDRSLAKPPL